MNTHHAPYHWIPVAIVLALALLTLSNVYGQHVGSTAVFDGRPAMAGANGGTGAMAGPPQGGIGIQGQDNAQVSLARRSSGVADMPSGTLTPNTDAIAENHAVRDHKDIIPRDRDSGMAKDKRSVAQRAKAAVKRVVQRSRHGASSDDIRTVKQ